jgi:UDP-glucose 4-epimerase
MGDKRVVLVTGVSGYWGARVAERLINENEQVSEADFEAPGFHVIGLDVKPPIEPIKGLDFIQADVRNPLLKELLATEGVHAVCHMACREHYRPSEKAFDLNVIGTMKVLGAASEAGVRKVIIRSSTQAYGAFPTNPAFITESHPLNGSKANGFLRNLVDIEAFCNGFRGQVPDMLLTILRFTNVIGPTVDSPMTRYLKMNPPRTLLGFDPLLQVIHENDAINAILFAVKNDVPGVFNVSGEGILSLSKLLALSGKWSIPVVHLLAYWGVNAKKMVGMSSGHEFPIEPDFLRYSWVADTTLMREQMGFTPLYTAQEALREFAGILRLKKYQPPKSDLAFDEERLRDIIDRRRRFREQQTG